MLTRPACHVSLRGCRTAPLRYARPVATGVRMVTIGERLTRLVAVRLGHRRKTCIRCRRVTSEETPVTPATDRLPSTFNAPLSEVDPEIAAVLEQELGRQRDYLEMIASENFVPARRARVAGLRAHQQVRRGLPRPPLLRRLRVRRRRREPRHRARQVAVRRRLRQRAAALGRVGQRRRARGDRRHPATRSSASSSRTAATSPTA